MKILKKIKYDIEKIKENKIIDVWGFYSCLGISDLIQNETIKSVNQINMNPFDYEVLFNFVKESSRNNSGLPSHMSDYNVGIDFANFGPKINKVVPNSYIYIYEYVG